MEQTNESYKQELINKEKELHDFKTQQNSVIDGVKREFE